MPVEPTQVPQVPADITEEQAICLHVEMTPILEGFLDKIHHVQVKLGMNETNMLLWLAYYYPGLDDFYNEWLEGEEAINRED